MPDTRAREATLMDTIERIRAEKFPDLDRELVREVLRLHADQSANPKALEREIDEAIASRVGEQR